VAQTGAEKTLEGAYFAPVRQLRQSPLGAGNWSGATHPLENRSQQEVRMDEEKLFWFEEGDGEIFMLESGWYWKRGEVQAGPWDLYEYCSRDLEYVQEGLPYRVRQPRP
jgi:hypothetical protein